MFAKDISDHMDPKYLLNILKKYSYDPFVIADENGIACFINDSYVRMTSVSSDMILGKHVSVLKERGLLNDNLAEQVLKSKKTTSKMLHYNNGQEMLTTAIPVFDEDNKFIAVVLNLRDMTDLNNLKSKLAHAKDNTKQIREELTTLKLHHKVLDDFVYESPQMLRLAGMARRIAKVDSTVLIEGESGVGKDVFAHIINMISNRDRSEDRPFIKISCGAIPESLLESELFGYEPGAFTGASKDGKAGMFELAKDGIIFLDEIGELPLSLQVKLLTVLQDRQFFKIGGAKPIQMDARVIAATNVNLEEAVAEKTFREDLYFRLNVINVTIPPLRERKEDIVPLTIKTVNKLNEKYNFNKKIDTRTLELFENYSWPGNVRELTNVVEQLIVLNPEDIVTEDQLPEKIRSNVSSNDYLENVDETSLKEFVYKMERLRIVKALEKYKTMKEAAANLEIDLSTLVRKINKYDIPKRYNTSYVHSSDKK